MTSVVHSKGRGKRNAKIFLMDGLNVLREDRGFKTLHAGEKMTEVREAIVERRPDSQNENARSEEHTSELQSH